MFGNSTESCRAVLSLWPLSYDRLNECSREVLSVLVLFPFDIFPTEFYYYCNFYSERA